MSLRLTDGDENRCDCGSVDWGGTGEVETALDVLRPCRSLIRDVRFEPINVTLPFQRRKGIST